MAPVPCWLVVESTLSSLPGGHLPLASSEHACRSQNESASERERVMVFCNLVSGVTSHHFVMFYSLKASYEISPHSRGRHNTEGQIPEITGATLEAAHHSRGANLHIGRPYSLKGRGTAGVHTNTSTLRFFLAHSSMTLAPTASVHTLSHSPNVCRLSPKLWTSL